MWCFLFAAACCFQQPQLFHQLHEVAYSYADQGKYQTASEIWSLLIFWEPEHDVALYHRSLAKAMLGDLSGAERDYQKATRCDGIETAKQWQTLVARNEWQAVIHLSRTMERTYGLNASGKMYLATAFHNLELDSQAGRLLKSVVSDLDTLSPQARRCFYELSVLHMAKSFDFRFPISEEKAKECISHCEQAELLGTKSINVILLHAYLNHKLGNHEEAVSFFRKAVVLDASDIGNRQMLILSLLNAKKEDDAVYESASLRRMVNNLPQNRSILNWLDQIEKAIQTCKRQGTHIHNDITLRVK